MTNYLKRLIFLDEKTRLNPLIYPFLFATLVYGIGFACFAWHPGVSSSSLWVALNSMHSWLPVIWGVGALGTSGFAWALLLLRKDFLGSVAAMLGFMVWFFAFLVYALNGFYLVMLTVAATNTYFWVWYYFDVRAYKRAKADGLIDV